MKRYYIYFFLIYSFFIKSIYSNQPAEPGLLFGKINRSSQNKILNRPVKITKQVRQDGTISNVFEITNLSQFLYLVVKPKKPVLFYLYSNSNDLESKSFYQKLADNFSDKVVFITINAITNMTLLKLLSVFLNYENLISINTGIKLPLVVFCKKGGIFLQSQNALAIRKNSLQLLSEPGSFNESYIKQWLEENLEF